MRTQFERDQVKVAVFQDGGGQVERIDVDVAGGLHEVVVKRVMRHGDVHWEIKGALLASHATTFPGIWEAIPTFIEREGQRYPIVSVVAEVVDATGRVTPGGDGLSSGRSCVEHAVEDFKRRFLGDQTMQLMRRLLEAEGYSVKPDREVMRKLGGRAFECFAYHEIAGELFDSMFSRDAPIHVEEMFKLAGDWSLLNEFLET